MAYDGFYSDLSTRGTTNQVLAEANQIKEEIEGLVVQAQDAATAATTNGATAGAAAGEVSGAAAGEAAGAISGAAAGAAAAGDAGAAAGAISGAAAGAAAGTDAANAVVNGKVNTVDLADASNPALGAGMVGYQSSTVYTKLGTLTTDVASKADDAATTASLATKVATTTLADVVTVTNGAAMVGRGVVSVSDVKKLLLEAQRADLQFQVKGYFANTSLGGGTFYWDAAKSKTLHDGGTIISPTVPWDGTFATLGAFHLGTGETSPGGVGCFVRYAVFEELHGDWFGMVPNDVTKDNAVVFTALHKAAIARAAPIMPIMVLPTGEITFSVSPNYAQTHAMRIKGQGLDGTRLRYTGTGAALLCDSSAFGGTFRTGFEASDMLIDLTSTGMAALRLVNVDRGQFTRVMSLNGAATSLHFDLQLAVLCNFDSCGMTVNRWAVSSNPQEIFRLASSALGQNTTACTFTNCSGEGATLANWRFIGADFNTTVGGTAEAASGAGRGVLFGTVTGCKGNVLIGMTMESNAGGDVLLSGLGNKMIGGYGISTGVGVTVANSAVGCTLEGMITHNCTIQSGALNNIVEGLKYNAKGGGTFSNLGTGTQMGAIYNMTSALYEYPRKASFGIPATLGAYTYINTTSDTVQVFIFPGGGVTTNITQILYKRTVGDTAVMNVATGALMLSPGDQVTVSSINTAPSMSGRRMFTGSL